MNTPSQVPNIFNSLWTQCKLFLRSRSIGLGRLPELSIISSFGLLLISFANNNARMGLPNAELLFWSGLLIIFIPIAFRLLSSQTLRNERIGLLLLLGISLYIVKLLNSPLYFSYFDEMQTWRTTNDIIKTKLLFQGNSLHPVGPLYPGLAITTSALVTIGNMSIFDAGIIVLGFARLVLILCLYLFYEKASQSELVASIGVLLYMTNPNFLFFDAQYAYETLALSFAAFILYGLTFRLGKEKINIFGITVICLLSLGAVVITHHITSYMTIIFICLWGGIAIIRKEGGASNPTTITIIGIVVCLTWMVYISTPIFGYLLPNISNGMNELIRIIGGEETGRELFRSFSGNIAPLWERSTSYASVGLIAVGLPIGLWIFKKKYRNNSLALTLALTSLAYFISHILRITQSGFPIAVRSSEFLFVPVAFILAIGFEKFLMSGQIGWVRMPVILLLLVIVFIGGITLGRPSSMRLPGPYQVVADSRSIEPQGIAAADWAKSYLGTKNRIGTDRINGILMGSIGEQYIITGIEDHIPVGNLFLTPDVNSNESKILKMGKFQYLVADLRLSSGLPVAGFYFQMSEPDAYHYSKPIDQSVILKFDDLNYVSRIFDSGSILIYDVNQISQ